MYTRIKICGIKTPEIAQVAFEAGADAIGLMFYEKSKRYVTLEEAKAICAILPPVITIVAVFVDPENSYVQEILKQLPISLLQFHGQETDEFCQSFNRLYIKAVPMQPNFDVQSYCENYPHAQGFLLDSATQQGFGGTGEPFLWDTIKGPLRKPIILAGGLTIANIEKAITTVRPFAVDVSGGVEIEPGKKDAQKIKDFIREVRRVNLSITG